MREETIELLTARQKIVLNFCAKFYKLQFVLEKVFPNIHSFQDIKENPNPPLKMMCTCQKLKHL